MRILAVGAHPDDIELGAGGTIARHVLEKDEVLFLVLSFGEKGGNKSERTSEAEVSARTLRVRRVKFAGLPDTEISDGIETILSIESTINEWKPMRVYTHCTKDTHQDHRNAAHATISAARKVPEIYSYESPLTHPNFTPQYFVDIADTIALKIAALRNFSSQARANRKYVKAMAVEGLARFRGFQAGVEYAEAFEVVRCVRLRESADGMSMVVKE